MIWKLQDIKYFCREYALNTRDLERVAAPASRKDPERSAHVNLS